MAPVGGAGLAEHGAGPVKGPVRGTDPHSGPGAGPAGWAAGAAWAEPEGQRVGPGQGAAPPWRL